MKDRGAVRRGKDSHFERLADLAPIDVKGRHNADILQPVSADHRVDQPRGVRGSRGSIVLDSLQQRAGTVADARGKCRVRRKTGVCIESMEGQKRSVERPDRFSVAGTGSDLPIGLQVPHRATGRTV